MASGFLLAEPAWSFFDLNVVAKRRRIKRGLRKCITFMTGSECESIASTRFFVQLEFAIIKEGRESAKE